jgi:hypothetical protein
MNTYPPSQENVLAVFLGALNTERAAKYVVIGRPDEVERNRAEVDYVLRDDARHPEIAVEVSSAWRSEAAGKEDADWLAWVEAVRSRVRGKAPGEFRLSTPMRIPPGLAPGEFAEAIVEVLERERESLVFLHRSGKGAPFTVCGISVFLSYAREGSDVSFARMLSEDDRRDFPEHVKRLVAKKSEKLRRHKETGRETWLVAFNTFWPAMSPLDVQEAVLAALGQEHGHIDHFGVVSGNPPDDAWLDVIR